MEGMLKNKSESSPLEPMTDKARRLTDDIQEIMAKFRVACKDGRKNDINVLVENGLQLLKELKEEISTSAPETPLPADTVGSFSDDLMRMLQFVEESDDATSRLSDLADLKPEPDAPTHQPTYPVVLQENSSENMVPQGNGCPAFFECNGSTFGIQNEVANGSDFAAHLDYLQFDFHQDFDHSNIFPNISPPPSAFLGPMCALWDCQRPAKCSEWCQDYCSSMHADLAFSEGGSGMNPVLRPGGIGLKDDRLFSALIAKVQGRHVGIPECEGAAIEKAPWKACKIFDLSLLEGETLREWLFFDKPRRAFESGNRKQRSLSDYNGRGWHESRKQMMKELGGHKRSYYMDPQPPGPFEWHLFEYVMNNSDVCALYKLELKLMGEKKIPKGKAINDPLIDLQNKMGMLTAEVSPENKPVKGKAKTNKIIDSGSSK